MDSTIPTLGDYANATPQTIKTKLGVDQSIVDAADAFAKDLEGLDLSTPPTESEVSKLDTLQQAETSNLAEDFSKELASFDISAPLTSEEKKLNNEYLKLPKANPKDFIDTAKEDWRIGQEGVDIDMTAADLTQQVLSTDQPVDLTELRARRQALAEAQYRNRADNLASRAAHGTVQMLPPMVGGQMVSLVTMSSDRCVCLVSLLLWL
jgi:hypothetical protein